MYNKRGDGFTLIELLVVIAIIAILAAILFPIFINARKSAQDSKCISNLKQIGGAMGLYLQDNGDRYPRVLAATGSMTEDSINTSNARASNPGVAYLMVLLFKYYKSPQIWQCPSGAKLDVPTDTLIYPKTPAINKNVTGKMPLPNGYVVFTNYVSYPLNLPLTSENYAEFCRGWTPAAAIQRWGKTFSDGGTKWNEGHRQPAWNNRLIQDGYSPNPEWRPHRKGTMVLFHDGHVARIRDYRYGNDLD